MNVEKADKAALQKLLNSDNIAEDLPGDKLSNIGRDVVEYCTADDASETRADKKLKWTYGKKLANQTIKPRKEGDGSDIKYPLLSVACIQFAARAYPELVPGWDVAKPKVIGDDTGENAEKRDQADAVCRFVNWQLFNQIEEWAEDTDRLLQMLPAYGCMFREVYSSAEERRIVTDICTPEDLIVPEGTKTIDTASRISKRFKLSPREILSKFVTGTYKKMSHPFEDEDKEAEETFIQQLTYLDLDEDGFKEPYLVVVHEESGEVVRISPNYRMDGIHERDGKIYKIDRVRYYVKYTFIPSLDGSFYDLGFYDLLYPLNETINSLLNNLVDAGTLANSNTGFISNNLGLKKRGKLKPKIGEYHMVDVAGDLRQHIMPMQFNGADQTLFALLGFVLDAARDVAQLKEVLEGTAASTSTATTTMALIEQGLKVFSAIYKRIHKGLEKELQLIREWNYYSTNPLYDEVLDLPKGVNPEWFNDDNLNFELVSDPQVVTDLQKMAQLEFEMQFVGAPTHDQQKLMAKIYEKSGLGEYGDVAAGMNPEVQLLQQELEGMTQQMQAIMQQSQEQIQAVTEELERVKQDKAFEQQVEILDSRRKDLDAKTQAIDSKYDNLVKLATTLEKFAGVITQEPGKQAYEKPDYVFDQLTGTMNAAS